MMTAARPRPPHARLSARPPIEKRAHDNTPQLCAHARERCAEMGVAESVAQQIVLHPDVVWETAGEREHQWFAKADAHPGYAVMFYRRRDGVPVIATVVFATDQDYDRDGATFIPREKP